jgi:ketosteroid isomerase-like protein
MEESDMNVANTVTEPESLAVAQRGKSVMHGDDELTIINAPQQALRSALAALSAGRVSEVVEQFDDRFTFNDHALTLEFTDKLRLTEFFEKSRELFPDSTLELVSLFASADHAIAEWKIAATQIMPYGSISYRFPISFRGSTIVRVENGRIVQWSDYYDENTSRRVGLAGLFTEWIEC